MAGANPSSENRVNKVLLFLGAGLLLTLSNAARAGAQCNQVCTENHENTFFGNAAGGSTHPEGANDSGFGFGALQGNGGGKLSTAVGSGALQSFLNGQQNTATGWNALFFLYSGLNYNTATGSQALTNNSVNYNTATGANALHDNTMGIQNTADGSKALYSNTTGNHNTAIGMSALTNQPGFNNSGYDNTADGSGALLSNTIGYNNVGLGLNALNSNTTGNSNLAMGVNAGLNLTTGSNDIDIGGFVRGVAGESNTIRLGAQGTQTATYIAGIAGTAVTGADVVVNSSSGQLGVVMSSARYKKDVRDMGASSDSLMKLRPVSFRYRNDGQGTSQCGLVAEEVEKVYPELVTYGANGKVETVRYSMLTSMLLNEVQKQMRQKQDPAAEMAELKASARMQIARVQARHEQELKELRATLKRRLSTIEQAMRTDDGNRPLATDLEE